MALPKLFNLITWHNNTTPAINEDNLNAMSQAIDDIDDRVIGLAGTIMEDVPQIQEDLEILEPAIENIDSNVERAETAADDAEDSAETAEYWANVSNPPIPVVKDFASVISVDDAIPKAATDVKVKIEAVQDLHGYTKPWVGGAGKNNLPMTVASIKAANSGTWSGNSIVKNGVTWTILTDSDGNVTGIKANGTASVNSEFNLFDSTSVLPNGSYILSGGVSNNVRIFLYDGSTYYDSKPSEVSFTLNNPSRVRCTCVVVNGNTASNVIFYPMIRLATVSDSTFEPYTNICPITGHSEANVTRTGKNLLPMTLAGIKAANTSGTWSGNAYTFRGITYTLDTDDNGNITQIRANGTATQNAPFYIVRDYKIAAFNDCIINGVNSGNNTSYGLFVMDTDYTVYAFDYDGDCNIETIGNSELGSVYMQVVAGYTANNLVFKPMIRLATETATDFAPYTGTDYIINLSGTRYGATLDVTSGVMTVTHGIIEFDGSDDENWSATSTAGAYYLTKNNTTFPYKWASDVEALANSFDYYGTKNGGYSNIGDGQFCLYYTSSSTNAREIAFKYTNITTLADWKTWLASNPISVVYELATPITVQLTPKEVQMLQGYNVLSANSGDVYLEYDASMIQRIANEKLDISTFKSVVASSSDFADFKTKVAAL